MSASTISKPTERHRVYDLVREAGVDVSDWANYRRSEHPASNPKYCYNWAFEGTDRVVLCLWHQEMREDARGIFQKSNYRAIASDVQHWTAKQRERAAEMDHAIQVANIKRLPIRVIVVDGSRRDDDERTASTVERRMLDPEPWHVATYEADGNCRLQRGPANSFRLNRAPGAFRLARIAYNSADWQRPTGEAGEQESEETYNAINKFGHEDWLFRAKWTIDGWRYAFIQGLNKSRQSYIGQPLDVTLFTIQPDKRRRLVATIYGVEALSDDQAKHAVEAFRQKGWLDQMHAEVLAVGGNPAALGANGWAEHVLNVRYRQENVDSYPADTFLADDGWIQDRHRYLLYKFGTDDRERVERTTFLRSGTQEALPINRLFRRGTKSVEYTPEHNRMQVQLLKELQVEYGKENVWLEKDYVDARVETESELIYFEIKTDLDPRAVIRQAIGQILEYAYHPVRPGRRPDRLVIVGRTKLRADDEAYLTMLRENFDLPITYRVVTI